MILRGGEIVIRMLADVKQKTIGRVIRKTIAPGMAVFTDEYDIYSCLPQWGYAHHTVCHAAGEFARDDDGDGFLRDPRQRAGGVLVAAVELAPPALRDLAGAAAVFFEFMHNVRRRGKALLGSLISILAASRNPG
jgi:transposase